MDGIYQRKKLKQPFKRKTLKFILLYPTIDKKLASVERKNRCIYWIFNGAGPKIKSFLQRLLF